MKNLPHYASAKQIEYLMFIEEYARVEYDGSVESISTFITKWENLAKINASLGDSWNARNGEF